MGSVHSDDDQLSEDDDEERANDKSGGRLKRTANEHVQRLMEATFNRMISNDFMTLVMYQDQKKRRDFVHDAWVVAKLCENTELKIAVCKDPYFYITRDDILLLLHTTDHNVINMMLANKVMLHITEDASYKMVKIKDGQVDQNQQTMVTLVDFLSVLVQQKRVDGSETNEVIFTHQHVVNFLVTHRRFLAPSQAIKVFILNRKFRLALQYLTDPDVPVEFDLEFFTFAIEANAYDIAFYLRYRFED